MEIANDQRPNESAGTSFSVLDFYRIVGANAPEQYASWVRPFLKLLDEPKGDQTLDKQALDLLTLKLESIGEVERLNAAFLLFRLCLIFSEARDFFYGIEETLSSRSEWALLSMWGPFDADGFFVERLRRWVKSETKETRLLALELVFLYRVKELSFDVENLSENEHDPEIKELISNEEFFFRDGFILETQSKGYSVRARHLGCEISLNLDEEEKPLAEAKAKKVVKELEVMLLETVTKLGMSASRSRESRKDLS